MNETKKCVNCGAVVLAEEESCPSCGSIHFDTVDHAADLPTGRSDEPVSDRSENVAAGIAGAFLFGLLGGGVYFGIYQLGYIAGICGFLIFFLANFGYGLFCGNKNSVSVARIVTCIIITLAVIFLSEYVAVAFDIYREFRKEGDPIPFVDILRMLPGAFADKEFSLEFFKELGIAVLMAAIAIASSVVKMIGERKKLKAQ